MAKKDEVNLDAMVASAREGANEALAAVLDAQFPAYFREFRAAFGRWAKDNPDKPADKFSFNLALVLKIRPAKQAGFEITAASGYSVKHKAVSNPAIVQLDLKLDDGKQAAA